MIEGAQYLPPTTTPSESGRADGPLMLYLGQPYDAKSAKARLDELDKDSDYTKALLAGDMAKVAERTAFSRMAQGKPPGVAPAPVDSGTVERQMSEREAEHNEKRLDAFDKLIVGGMSPLMREQYGRGLATKEQHDLMTRERARLLADPAFVERIHPRVPGRKPDPTAIEQWIHACQVSAARVAPDNFDWGPDASRS